MCPFAQNNFLNKNDVSTMGRLRGARAFSQGHFLRLNQKKIYV
jgi:hypothetical protein